jgi:hypothetical protein
MGIPDKIGIRIDHDVSSDREARRRLGYADAGSFPQRIDERERARCLA